MDQPWRIEMFGWLRAVQGDRVVSRFRTRKAEALLAYLAYHAHRSYPREQLIELLWPEGDPSAGRRSLSTELTSLRRQLEPPGVPHGAVLVATCTAVRLNPAACVTDVALFEAALQAAKRIAAPAERAQQLIAGAELYRGELLPGCFEEWILPERLRLADAFLQALHTLVGLLEDLGDRAGALQWARRAVAADPLDEESHHRLIRLLLAAGQVEAARAQHEHGQHLLLGELGLGLSPEIHALMMERAPPKDRPRAVPVGGRRKRRRSAASPDPQLPPAGFTASWGIDEGSRAAPALQSLGAAARPRDNLPLRFTRFFGREREIARLREALGCRLSPVSPVTPGLDFTDGRQPTADGPRLVTLTGPGGTGKTRLALQVAQQLRELFPGGVWFVSLRDLTDPALIPDQILLALRLPRVPHMDALEQVVTFLSRAPALLLLDNFEHLVEGGAQIVQRLLQQVERLAVLATSRQRLGLEGEREFPVSPLPVPADGPWFMVDGPTKTASSEPSTINHQLLTFAECPSVALFVDRAQAARPDFQVTARNAMAVAGLCQRLEGLPLAIELAAARAGILTPQQMISRLEQRFELLAGRQRSADPRHRSLRAALDWSYQLLPPELQWFFARLSVFRGGFTLEAAPAVCGEDGVGCSVWGVVNEPAPDRTPNTQHRTPTLDCLEELQQCSLVVTEVVGEEMRYRLLETLREYGAEQLSADERTALAQRHLAYYVALVEKTRSGYTGRPQAQYLDQMEREHDNLRAALDWMVESGAAVDWMLKAEAAVVGWDFIPMLSYIWWARGYATEGRRRLAEILALPGAAVPTAGRARLLLEAGRLAHQQGDFVAADALLQESRAINRKLGHQEDELECCGMLAALAREQGDYARARSFYERVVAAARERGDEGEIAVSVTGIGYTAYLEGDLDTAQPLLEEALRMLRKGQASAWACVHLGKAADTPYHYPAAHGHLAKIAWACAYLGEVADARSDYAAAHAYLEEGVDIFREFGREGDAAYVIQKLGRAAQHQGLWHAAADHFTKSLAVWQQIENRQGITACLEGLAAVASGQGEAERAARLLGAAAALRESRGITLPPVERADLDRVIAGVRASLGETGFVAAWADGQATPVHQVIAAALQTTRVQS